MSERDTGFKGEDANAGMASPVMDLIAAGVLAAIAIWMMVEALRLPIPGALPTAPGLLPFVTAASLMLMALILAVTAIQRRRLIGAAADRFELPPDFGRTVTLAAIVLVYVAGIQYVPVDVTYAILGVRSRIGSFEAVSVIVLTAILRLYWGQPLWTCLAVGLGWIAFLSITFRTVFHIQLP